MNTLSHDSHRNRQILQVFQAIRLVATDMDGTLTVGGKFTPALVQSFLDLAAVGQSVLIVTGRSAGWVSGLVSYLPIAGAIAENGGLFYQANSEQPILLTPIAELKTHRQQLQEMFRQLQAEFPQLQESIDNAFRLTDWTFDVAGLSPDILDRLRDRTQQAGWGFTYSSVQCHIKPADQEKAKGLLQVLGHYFPNVSVSEVVTVGDSPNDSSLFNRDLFPHSVGVANVREYLDRLSDRPRYITQSPEGLGFGELAKLLIAATQPETSTDLKEIVTDSLHFTNLSDLTQ
ncbi:MAG: Cof-type HAD-IIB family hydrolase [Desertifilum sp.]|nr:Cof-type HAD-IIB family hydrolase [Desertifilum sp.]